ncbi:hypothetical protein M0812_02182 [Anaeramoeba flamelloides]|uniref:Uncharacterized protein n=1 Tax=Anaeramoeba flamelloides TaxID=1746091 RepID=A0AAV7Z256_9EUKA|nr:hypothetical protein M0812_02182 [Anaeramoeba flamelloides]
MDLNEITKNQPKLLSKARKILVSFPQPGLYDKEPKEDFPKFIRFVKDLFEKDEGERGILKREIQKEFKQKEKEFQYPLSLCGCDVGDPIDYIYYRFGLMKKGKEYDNYILLKHIINKATEFIQGLETQGSKQREKIKKGMVAGILKKLEKQKKSLQRSLTDKNTENETQNKLDCLNLFDQDKLYVSKNKNSKENEKDTEIEIKESQFEIENEKEKKMKKKKQKEKEGKKKV